MEDLKELAKALNEFQAELVTVGRSSNNPFFKSKYADLADIMLASQPVVTKHGLSVVQLPDNLDGQPALTTYLMHVSGQSVKATVPLILAKQDPQGVGSAITYMRRYGYAAALQIVIDEDNDGNKASGSAKVSQPAPRATPKPVAKFDKPLTGMATDRQKELIASNLAKQGVSLEEMPGHLMETYGVETPLTKEGASFVLDDLFEQNSYTRKEPQTA